MRLLKNGIALAIGALGLTAVAASTGAQAQTVIKYSSWLPGNHWLNVDAVMLWMADVEKATNGRVKVEILPKTVGTPQSQFDVVTDGLADMGVIVTGYTPGRFPMAEMGELPFNGENPLVLGPVFDRVYRKHFAKANEFKGVEVLSIFSTTAGHFLTAKKQIRTMEDLKGLKLRSASNTGTRVLNLVGAVPILKSSTEAFEMLSSGLIDGSLMFRETVKSTNSVELLHHAAMVPGGIFSATLGIIWNEGKWKSIPEADRKAIMAVSGDKAATYIGKGYAKADQAGVDAMTAAKYDVQYISPAMLAELKKAVAPVEQEWIDAAKKKGAADPAAALKEYRSEVAKAEAALKK